MKCPHCSAEEPEGATECPNCGFIYAKWRAAQAAAPAPPPVIRVQEESSPIVLWGGLAAAVMAYFFFFRSPAPGPAPEPEPRRALAGPALPAQAAEPVPEGWWRLQGRILDLSRSEPLAGARVVLQPGGAQTQSDEGGLFQLAGAPLPSGNYSLDVTHPKFSPQYIAGSRDEVLSEYQARRGCPKVLEREEINPRSGELVQLDFGLCPKR